jgi:Lrp/AsnC family leucine-responsive transcriptional regulator
MEKTGVIAGYTVVLGDAEPKSHIDALISISVAPADRQYFITMVENQPGVAQCFHVTGSHSFIVKVSCAGIHELEHLINRFQKLGQTSTQIILSAPVDRRFTLDVHEHGKDPV